MVQAKDIDTDAILRFLAGHQGIWATWGKGYSMPTVQDAMPEGTPAKVQLAKMRALHRQGFVGGCACGCRGDWEITDLGLARIGHPRTKPYNGYGERAGSVRTGRAGAIRWVSGGAEEAVIVRQAQEAAAAIGVDPTVSIVSAITLETAWEFYGEPGDRTEFERLVRQALEALAEKKE